MHVSVRGKEKEFRERVCWYVRVGKILIDDVSDGDDERSNVLDA